MNRCDWCIGFIRRDCTIMERCVQTGWPGQFRGEPRVPPIALETKLLGLSPIRPVGGDDA